MTPQEMADAFMEWRERDGIVFRDAAEVEVAAKAHLAGFALGAAAAAEEISNLEAQLGAMHQCEW